jgi:hypothetical protein
MYSSCVLSVWWLQVVWTIYSNQELADTHFMHGLADCNAVVAHRLYHERYPRWRCPERKTFLNIHCHLRKYWNFDLMLSTGTTKIYDSLSRGGYSGCCECDYWNQYREGISASGCRSFDCVESVAGTAAVSLPSAACIGLVTTIFSCACNVLPVVLTAVWYKS